MDEENELTCIVIEAVENDCYKVFVKELEVIARLVWHDCLGPLAFAEEIEGLWLGKSSDSSSFTIAPDLPRIRHRKIAEKKARGEPNASWPAPKPNEAGE